jgi:hypothetical protein
MKYLILFVFVWAAWVAGRSYESENPVKRGAQIVDSQISNVSRKAIAATRAIVHQ